MSLFTVFNITGTGMSAQSMRLNTTASNIANADSVSSSVDEAYKLSHPASWENPRVRDMYKQKYISIKYNLEKSPTLKQKILSQKLSDKKIREAIKLIVEETDGAYRGGIVFKKNRFNESHLLYSPFYQKGIKNNTKQQISDNYDYTIPDITSLKETNTGQQTPRTFWFHEPLKKGAMWLPPYYGTRAKNWLSEYIRPFSSNYDNDTNNGYDGIIFMNFSLSGLSKITSKLDLGNSGYAFILSNKDVLISYPDKEFLGQSLSDIQTQDKLIETLIALRHKGDMTRFIHPINKKEAWLIFKPIKGSDFSLGILVLAEEVRAKFNIGAVFPYNNVSLVCTIAAFILSLESVFAAISGWLFLSQTLTISAITGCVMIFVAILIADVLPPQWLKFWQKRSVT